MNTRLWRVRTVAELSVVIKDSPDTVEVLRFVGWASSSHSTLVIEQRMEPQEQDRIGSGDLGIFEVTAPSRYLGTF